MTDVLPLVLAFVAGAGLGGVFFGGLWWTVHRGASSRSPALWFLGSALVRTSVVLAGFYMVGGGQWQRLLWCLFGFVLARLAILRMAVPAVDSGARGAPEASHAP